MKALLQCSAVVLGAALVLAVAALAAPKTRMPHQPPPVPASSEPVASIHVRGKPKASERVALAKISFVEAMKTALTAVPGRIASGELAVDEGDLVYDFVIIKADHKAIEVSIDAGDGKVLEVDDGDDE